MNDAMNAQASGRILIVDDDPSIRRLLCYALENEGYRVQEAEDGVQALEQYEQFKPDLILLDVLMPRLDGFEVCAQIQTLPGGAGVPVLMVTALDDTGSVERAFAAGATDFITKPVNRAVLTRRVRRLLQAKQAQEQVHFQASILDQVRNAVIATDAQGIVIYANKAAGALCREADTLIGRRLGCIAEAQPGNPRLEALLEHAGQHGFWDGELAVWHEEGTTLPVHMTFTALRDHRGLRIGYVGVLTDITERKRAEAALEKSRELYSTLASNFPNGTVLLFDPDLRLTIAGGLGLADMGLSSKEMEGKTIWEVFEPGFCAMLEPLYRDALAGYSRTVEVPYADRVYLSYTLPVRDEHGEIFAGMGMTQDITTLKQTERELSAHRDHLEALVEERTAELKASNEALQQQIIERERVEAKLAYRLEFEKIIAAVSAHFINLSPGEIDKGIDLALHAIGQFSGLDRGYVFRLSDDVTRMDNTHEWCAEGVEPQLSILQGLPIQLFPWWIERIFRLENVVVPRVSDLPPEANTEYRFFSGRKTQSFVTVPMIYNGYIVGILGFDSVREARDWSDDLVALLKITGEIFVNALEHKRAQESLYRSEQQLRQITDTMLDTIYQTNAEGIIEYASPSCWDVLGHNPATMIGHSIYAQVHPEDVEMVREAVHNVGRVEYRYRHAHGHYVWLETLSNLLLADNGSIEGIVFASRDITERKRIEWETRELDRLKTEFLSTAAHELRTPLTSIRGFSEILLTRTLDEERQRRYLKMINEQSTHLGAIIDDLLDLSRLEAKRSLTLMLEPVDMAALLEETVKPFSEATPTHQFRIENQAACPPISGDVFRLGQVVKNLLSNAIKYSPAGGTVTLRNRVTDDYLEISVQDEGIGMTPEQQAHLFEKFYRADASNTAISGTGLGLAISKLIVELHGGKIWAESESGKGTTFFFTLPLKQIQPSEVDSQA